MTSKKIIPCLDIKDGQVVKGVNFFGVEAVGDPVAMAKAYEDQGADELVLLDIMATVEGRGTLLDLVRFVSEIVQIPLTVGGGIRSLDDIRAVLEAGATKVGINSQAVRTPELIAEGAAIFGSEAIVAAIDGKKDDQGIWRVVVNGGNTLTDQALIPWTKEMESRGAGSILLTSMDADGVQSGYDLAMTQEVCAAVSIPVIASGGAGRLEDFSEVFAKTGCAAALAASVFHFETLTVADIKEYLEEQGL